MSVCTRGAAKTTRSSSGIQLSICLGKERKQGPNERERLWGAGGGRTDRAQDTTYAVSIKYLPKVPAVFSIC